MLIPLIMFGNKPEKPVLMYSCYTLQHHIIVKGSMCGPVSILERYIEDTMVTVVLNYYHVDIFVQSHPCLEFYCKLY